MTSEEMAIASEMWRNGEPVRLIARSLGYSDYWINQNAYRHRELFPYRKTYLSDEEKAVAAERVLSGELTVTQMARRLGVHKSAMSKWVKERREGKWKTT